MPKTKPKQTTVKKKEISVIVGRVQQDDVNKGIVKVDEKTMKELGIRKGEPIEILGKSKTAAVALPFKKDTPTILMDSLTRKNANALIGNKINIKKPKWHFATEITICPAEKDLKIKWDKNEAKLRKNLIGRVTTENDIITLGGSKERLQAKEEEKEGYLDTVRSALKSNGNGGYKLVELKFLVEKTAPSGVVVIGDKTKINFNEVARDIETDIEVYYDDIGGLDEEIRKVRELVEMPFFHPEVFDRLGIDPPHGILLYGPPGTGKTLLAKAIANETQTHFVKIEGPEILDKMYGESEAKLRQKFEQAAKKTPAIIFIDELDAIAEKRDKTQGPDKKVVTQLLVLMDGVKKNRNVIVIGATNRVNAIDPALRRPGRFDREVNIGVPNKAGRLEILKIHTRGMPLAKDVDLCKVASKTHGYVGADIAALCRETAMNVLRKVLPKYDKDEEIPIETLNKLVLTQKDFEEAILQIRPSAMREVLVERPTTKWVDIGGLDDVKQQVKEAVEWPLKKPESFKRIGIKPPKGIMLSGPPGTGKTLLAKAIANETEANFISIKGPELKSMWVGKSEENVRDLFEKAKQNAPCILFFDEIDALVGSRVHHDTATETASIGIVQQILTEMDGLEDLKGVVVIGATNRIQLMDPAFLRPGRIDRIINVPLPDFEARVAIFKIHTRKMPLAKDVEIIELAHNTAGRSGADIAAICMEAGILALRENENAKEVRKEHFDFMIENFRADVYEGVSKSTERAKGILNLARMLGNMG